MAVEGDFVVVTIKKQIFEVETIKIRDFLWYVLNLLYKIQVCNMLYLSGTKCHKMVYKLKRI